MLPSPPLRPDECGPSVEVLEEIGRGAWGVVYRARDRATQREVAVKVLLEPERSPARRDRFLREGQITASLKHPGIVGVHSFWVHRDRFCLGYELIEGCRTLDQAAAGADLATRVDALRQAAAALGHAHALGVVHRDVKAENILVDGAGRVRVADFGVATARGVEALTRTGQLVGTPYTMAPEQLKSAKTVTPAADVWSLGVLLYEAITGRPPFEATTLIGLIHQIGCAEPKHPLAHVPTLHPDLVAVCLRALSADPRERYPDGAALGAALDDVLARGALRASASGRRLLGAGAVAVAGAVLAGVLLSSPGAGGASSSPGPAAVTVEQVVRALASGELKQALAMSDALGEPQRAHLGAEALLRLGRPKDAIVRVGVGGDRASRRIRARAALELARFDEALAELAGDDRPEEAVRLHAVTQLVAGEFKAGAEALESAERPVVLAARRERELRAWVAEFDQSAQGSLLLDHARTQGGGPTGLLRDVVRLGATLDRADPLARAVLLRAQATIADAVLRLLNSLGRTSREKAPLEDAVLAVEDWIRPSPFSARLTLIGALVRYHRLGDRIFGVEGDVLPDPASGWASGESPQLQFVAWGLWFLEAPGLERRSAAEQALALPDFSEYFTIRARREILIRLTIALRNRAWELRLAHDPRAAQVAQEALETIEKTVVLTGALGESTIRQVDPTSYELTELVLCALLTRDVTRAKAIANRLTDPERRTVLQVECALIEGDLDGAERLLGSLQSAATLEAHTAQIHLVALRGEPAAAKLLLAERLPALSSLGVAVNAPWHSPAGLAEVLKGAWWPGHPGD